MSILNANFEIGENPTVRDGTLIYPYVKIGDRFQSGNYTIIREYATVGNDCSIGTFSEIGHDCVIGNGVRIHSKCFVPEYTIIEDNVWIGPGVTICNTFHPKCERAKECLKKTAVLIRSGAIISAGCVLMPGIILGRDCVVGAGSLVTKSVDSNCVVFGNPAEHYTFRGNIQCHFDDEFRPYRERLSIPPKEIDE